MIEETGPIRREGRQDGVSGGSNPVHPISVAYRTIAECLERNANEPNSKYTKPLKLLAGIKRPKIDHGLERAGWVSGLS
jgi:hypothetical protein